MCPKSVVTGCDTKTRHEIVCNCPEGRLQLKRRPVCCNKSIDGKADDEGDIQPVDMFVPVRLGNCLVGDVRFLRFVLLARRLKRLGHVGWRLLHL